MEVDIIEDTNKATEKIEQPSLEKNIVEFNLNDWHYSQTNSSITLNSYKGTSKEIYIPGEYNSKQVILGLNFYFPRDPVSIDIIEVNGKKVKLTNNSLNQRFYGSNAQRVNLTGLDVSNVTNMTNVFRGAKYLTELDISNWDTSNVTNMALMFNGAESLEQLDLSSWDTSNVTNMDGMFYGCKSLIKLDVSGWNTSKTNNMFRMFYGCESLTQLDVSNWNTSNVTTMEAMFSRNESLTQLDASNWDTSNVTNMNYMFRYYENSNGLPLLVITTDNKLANYYYKGDWRLPAAPRFDANGGIFSDGSSTSKPLEIFTIENISEATIQQKLNDALALVETPTKVGNSFNGWENLNTSTNIIDKLNSNFLAKWNVNSYKVTYETDGGSAVPEADVTFDELINEPTAPTKEGYTFDGWYKEADYQNIWDFATEKMPASNVTLYAKWTINSYNVTFDSQGGSSVPGGTVNFDELVAKPQDPTREGYKFEGWYTDDTFATEWDFGTNKMPSKDITLYAKWNVNSYNVTFDSQGGSSVLAGKVNFDELVVKPQDPTREGYTFGGWYTDDTFATEWDFDSDKMPSKDITLYAKWNHNEAPVIFAEGITIKVGSEFNPLANVRAEDKEDGEITEKVKVVENTVNTNKAGIYSVTYEVNDSNGLTTRKTIVVIVEEKNVIILDKENNNNNNNSNSGNKVTITEISNSNKDNNKNDNTNNNQDSNVTINSEEGKIKDPIKPELGQLENAHDEGCVLHWLLLLLSAGTLGSIIVSRQRFKKKIEKLVEQNKDK